MRGEAVIVTQFGFAFFEGCVKRGLCHRDARVDDAFPEKGSR
jgi:hypothetical protein